MPYELKELAAISGMPGLYRLVKAARHGVLVESLDEKAARSLAPARNKVSLLSEISIYTQNPDETVPLGEVFERVHQQYGNELGLTNKSTDAELTDFLGNIIPDYDRDRVYLSDIRKLVSWYNIVSQHLPYQEAPAAEAGASTDEAEAATGATGDEAAGPGLKAAEEAAEEAAEPAADEPLSTGGVIPEQEPTPDVAAGNPEAGVPAKKGRKKADNPAE